MFNIPAGTMGWNVYCELNRGVHTTNGMEMRVQRSVRGSPLLDAYLFPNLLTVGTGRFTSFRFPLLEDRDKDNIAGNYKLTALKSDYGVFTPRLVYCVKPTVSTGIIAGYSLSMNVYLMCPDRNKRAAQEDLLRNALDYIRGTMCFKSPFWCDLLALRRWIPLASLQLPT